MPRSRLLAVSLALALAAGAAPARAQLPQPGDRGVPAPSSPTAVVEAAAAATGGLSAPRSQLGAPFEHVLHFVLEAGATTADGGVVLGHGGGRLGELHDLCVAAFAPGVWPSARIGHALAELNAWLGDEDLDGDFFEAIGGEIDALALASPPAPGAAPQLQGWLFSFEAPWGAADPAFPHDGFGALDGTLFALDHDAQGRRVVRRALREALILEALGQGQHDDLDVDALALDAQGNLYLSFRSTEWVDGELLADDGVVCLPADAVDWDADGEAWWVEPAGAVVVLDKPAVDALVEHAQLAHVGGAPLGSLTDLSALAIDPAGGHFAPSQPVPGMPHGVPNLLFTGSKLGAAVLSTRDGGTPARLNGRPLAGAPVSGARLGLADDSVGAAFDLAALSVTPAHRPDPVIVPEHGSLDPIHHPQAILLLDGFTPGGLAWLLLDAELPAHGSSPLAQPWAGGGCDRRFVAGTTGIAPVPIDGFGRARVVLPGQATPGGTLLALAQAWDASSRRLSRPAAIWCGHGGPLAGGTGWE